MRIKTILNRMEKHKSFIYKQARFGTDKYGNERQIKAILFVKANPWAQIDDLKNIHQA